MKNTNEVSPIEEVKPKRRPRKPKVEVAESVVEVVESPKADAVVIPNELKVDYPKRVSLKQ